MKLESLTGDKSESPPDNTEEQPIVATFNNGDTVMLKSSAQSYSSDLIRIAGVPLKVDRCFTKDLGEKVSAEIVYLIGDKVNNPYLAEHFKKIE